VRNRHARQRLVDGGEEIGLCQREPLHVVASGDSEQGAPGKVRRQGVGLLCRVDVVGIDRIAQGNRVERGVR